MKLAVCLGGTESLAEHPQTMTHADVDPADQARIGITPALVRLSVGIEDADDLAADLGAALDAGVAGAMQLDAFEAMVRELSREMPDRYFDGVSEIVVSPRAVPHPVHGDVFTLGECIALPLDGEGPESVQSRVVLYHGSFRALAELDPAFDWREEAWETLTHELRHHVEWRARRDDLGASDEAADQNWARQRGEPFDPLFHLDGEELADGVFQVDEDWFLDRVVREMPHRVDIGWHGRRYFVTMPRAAVLPAFVALDGVEEPPAGDLVLVLRRRPRWRDLFRPTRPWQGRATVSLLEGD